MYTSGRMRGHLCPRLPHIPVPSKTCTSLGVGAGIVTIAWIGLQGQKLNLDLSIWLIRRHARLEAGPPRRRGTCGGQPGVSHCWGAAWGEGGGVAGCHGWRCGAALKAYILQEVCWWVAFRLGGTPTSSHLARPRVMVSCAAIDAVSPCEYKQHDCFTLEKPSVRPYTAYASVLAQ